MFRIVERAHAAGSAWQLVCDGASATWAQACLTRAAFSEGSKSETWLAVNPKDPENLVVAAKDLNPELSNNCVWSGVFYTKDGGKTWTETFVAGKYAERGPTSPYYGYGCNTDPMFAFAPSGDVHFGVEMYEAGWKVVLATSRDGGETWPEAIVLHPDIVATTDYSRMTVNPRTGSVIEGINNYAGLVTGIACHVVVSRDGGRSADPPVRVQVPENPGANCRIVSASPAGAVVLGFIGSEPVPDPNVLVEDTGETWWYRSADDGRTFIDWNPGFRYVPVPRNLPDSPYRSGTGFEAAYDASGRLYVVYADLAEGDADILLRSSGDDGKSWTEPVRVNTDATGAHQFMPNLAVAGDGSVHVFYLDRGYDPEKTLIDVTRAWSLDGGLTWTNERVTTVGWDGRKGEHQNGFAFVGDYIGVAAHGDTVWAAVPDAGSTTNTTIAVARVALKEP